MSVSRRIFCQGAAATALATVAGCGPRVPKPTPIIIMINADAGINPNEAGHPSPIVVRVYELKGVKAFNNATFFEIMDDDTKILGADMINSYEYEMTPGKEQKYDRQISSEATHLGVVAGFREIQSAKWRDSIQLETSEKNEFMVYITSAAVRIQKLRRRRLGIF